MCCRTSAADFRWFVQTCLHCTTHVASRTPSFERPKHLHPCEGSLVPSKRCVVRVRLHLHAHQHLTRRLACRCQLMQSPEAVPSRRASSVAAAGDVAGSDHGGDASVASGGYSTWTRRTAQHLYSADKARTIGAPGNGAWVHQLLLSVLSPQHRRRRATLGSSKRRKHRRGHRARRRMAAAHEGTPAAAATWAPRTTAKQRAEAQAEAQAQAEVEAVTGPQTVGAAVESAAATSQRVSLLTAAQRGVDVFATPPPQQYDLALGTQAKAPGVATSPKPRRSSLFSPDTPGMVAKALANPRLVRLLAPAPTGGGVAAFSDDESDGTSEAGVTPPPAHQATSGATTGAAPPHMPPTTPRRHRRSSVGAAVSTHNRRRHRRRRSSLPASGATPGALVGNTKGGGAATACAPTPGSVHHRAIHLSWSPVRGSQEPTSTDGGASAHAPRQSTSMHDATAVSPARRLGVQARRFSTASAATDGTASAASIGGASSFSSPGAHDCGAVAGVDVAALASMEPHAAMAHARGSLMQVGGSMGRIQRVDLACRLVDAYAAMGDAAGACEFLHEAVLQGWLVSPDAGPDADVAGDHCTRTEEKGEHTSTGGGVTEADIESRWKVISHVVRCLIVNGYVQRAKHWDTPHHTARAWCRTVKPQERYSCSRMKASFAPGFTQVVTTTQTTRRRDSRRNGSVPRHM